jgi:hypothetical protein
MGKMMSRIFILEKHEERHNKLVENIVRKSYGKYIYGLAFPVNLRLVLVSGRVPE